eukprot:Rhum_TRINITY_DN14462_c13_g1::Rhum_TRINITY_DN14462_c13_g1_i1::g.90858::m.90858
MYSTTQAPAMPRDLRPRHMHKVASDLSVDLAGSGCTSPSTAVSVSLGYLSSETHSAAASSSDDTPATLRCRCAENSDDTCSSVASPLRAAAAATARSSGVGSVDGVGNSSFLTAGGGEDDACACNRSLTLYSHNVYFLPTIARLVTSGREALQKDRLRAEALSRHIVSSGYDFVCLQEMFRQGPRRLVRDRLALDGYHVVERFNENGTFSTNSGLFFASRYPLVHHDFHEFPHATFGTSDFLARKGVGMSVVDVGCGKKAAIFFTHTQAETSGAAARQLQLQRCVVWMCAKLKSLAAAGVVDLQSTAVLLAGDLNVDGNAGAAGAAPAAGTMSAASTEAADSGDESTCTAAAAASPVARCGSSGSEFEAMLATMRRPHDLLRYSVGDDAISEVQTCCDSGRLDYIFSWRLCDGTADAQTDEHAARQSRRLDQFLPSETRPYKAASAIIGLAAALALPVSLSAATVMAAASALAAIPKKADSSREEEAHYNEAASLLEETALLHVHKCETQEGWEVAPGHAVSDHHALILSFSMHPHTRV